MTAEEFYELNSNVNQKLSVGQTVRVYDGEPPCNNDEKDSSDPIFMEFQPFENFKEISLFLCVLYAQGIKDQLKAIKIRSDLIKSGIMQRDGSISDIFNFATELGYEKVFTSYPNEDKDDFIKINGYKLQDGTIHFVLASNESEKDNTVIFNPSKKISKQPTEHQQPVQTYYFID